MLLEKNSILEEKLLKLQSIVEQTKIENDVSVCVVLCIYNVVLCVKWSPGSTTTSLSSSLLW